MTADPRLLKGTMLLGTSPNPDRSPEATTPPDDSTPVASVARHASGSDRPPGGTTVSAVAVGLCVDISAGGGSAEPPAVSPPRALGQTLPLGMASPLPELRAPAPAPEGRVHPPALGAQGTVRIGADDAAQIQAQIAEARQGRAPGAETLPEDDGDWVEAAQAAELAAASVTIPTPVAAAVPVPARRTSERPVSSPPPGSPGAAPARGRGKGKVLLIVLLGGALLVAALLVAFAVGYALYRQRVAGVVEPAAPVGLESDRSALPIEGAAPPRAEATAPAGAVPGEGVMVAPASGSGNAIAVPAPVAAGVEPVSPNVLLTCSPQCERLKRITCDGREERLVAGGLRLDSGKRVCVFSAPGYQSRTVVFEIADDEPLEVTVALRRRDSNSVAVEPCGTFLNPCE